jgi:hypothetical protein
MCKKGHTSKKSKGYTNPWFKLLQAKEHKIRNAKILLIE